MFVALATLAVIGIAFHSLVVVAEHRLEEDEALEVAHDLAYRLVKKTYRL